MGFIAEYNLPRQIVRRAGSFLSRCPQGLLEILELVLHPLVDGPAPDLAKVDLGIPADEDGLGERRLVVPVIKRGQSVLDAVRGGEEAEDAIPLCGSPGSPGPAHRRPRGAGKGIRRCRGFPDADSGDPPSGIRDLPRPGRCVFDRPAIEGRNRGRKTDTCSWCREKRKRPRRGRSRCRSSRMWRRRARPSRREGCLF